MKTYQNHAMTDAEARQVLADACKQVETNLPLYTYQCQNHSSVGNIYPGCANNQWTCGFWPGEIWLAYEATGEEKFKTAALIQVDSFADRIARKVEVDHHDMGFLYSPTCVAAWKLVGSEKGKNAAIAAADQLLTRLPGEDLYSGMTPAQRAAQKLMEEYATLNDATTRREEWMAVQAIMTGSIPVVGEGVNEVIDFGFTNKVTLSGDNKWGGSKADIQGNLGDWVDKVLHGGFANVDMAILGKTAKKHLFNDATIQKMLDNRRMNMGELAPRDLPNGVRYLGRLTDPSLELYSYGEVYYDDWTDPEEPATKPLVPDNQVVLISSRPNYMLAYGLCTYIDDASQMWVTAQTSRLLRSYVEHHPDRRMVELQTHPLPIPDKVDSWMVATVC